MSDQIVAGYSEKHNAGITLLSQQLTRATMGSVIEQTMQYEREKFDQIGSIRLQRKKGRAVPIPVVETPQKARYCTAFAFEARDFVDELDKLKVFNDPTNAYTTVQAAAAARESDKILIDAAVGDAYEGDHGADAVPLPGTQIIPHADQGYTVDKLKAGIEKLKSANALLPTDSIHGLWTAIEEHQLMNATEVKSSEFNNDKVMVNGELTNFFKVNFRRVEDYQANDAGRMLPYYLDGIKKIRRTLLFVRSGITFGTLQAPIGRVEWNVERSAYQISTKMAAGGVRMEDAKVVIIESRIA